MRARGRRRRRHCAARRSTTRNHRFRTASPCGSSATPGPRKTSAKTCSSRSWSVRRPSIRRGAACGRGWGRSPTVARSTTCVARSSPPRAEREASRAVSAPDVEEMATALLSAERVRAALICCLPSSAAPSNSRVLRREDLPAGRRDPGHSGGHGEVAFASGASPYRRRPRSRRKRMVSAGHELSDAEVEDLLGVYALDAWSPRKSQPSKPSSPAVRTSREAGRLSVRQRGSEPPKRWNRPRVCGPACSRRRPRATRAPGSRGRPLRLALRTGQVRDRRAPRRCARRGHPQRSHLA